MVTSFKTDDILEEFTLSQNRISDKAVEIIMKAIQTDTCTNLKLLDISSNNLFDNVAVVIGECLTCNTTLEVLDISKNYITDRGIKILANAIQANATLLKLFLCSNSLSDGGVVAIGKCLTINNSYSTRAQPIME